MDLTLRRYLGFDLTFDIISKVSIRGSKTHSFGHLDPILKLDSFESYARAKSKMSHGLGDSYDWFEENFRDTSMGNGCTNYFNHPIDIKLIKSLAYVFYNTHITQVCKDSRCFDTPQHASMGR